MKVIFDTRPNSGYRDSVDRYHFPTRYLRAARAAVGDWAVYYEPSRAKGRRAYVAVARVEGIEPDLDQPGQYFALIRDYLPFDTPVPLRGLQGYREARLRKVADSRDVGRALQGWSVRELLDEDFREIVKAGLQETLALDDAIRLNLDLETAEILGTPPADRVIERMLVNRTIRDAAFRRAVLDAYDNTCAVTGLRIVNDGGRAEAQAAHIVPVSEGGPDVIQNGIALSATAHWLFDQHLISVGEDWRLLINYSKVPASLRSIFVPNDAPIRLPGDPTLWPHPAFMMRHREHFAFG